MNWTKLQAFTYWPHVITALVILMAFTGYRYFAYYDTRSTDAYVSAHVVNMATIVSGPITKIYVTDNQAVKKGDKLFEVDPRPYLYAMDKARADLNIAVLNYQNEKVAIQVAEEKLKQRLIWLVSSWPGGINGIISSLVISIRKNLLEMKTISLYRLLGCVLGGGSALVALHAVPFTLLRIIAHIERLKADNPTKIAIFTKALNKLSDFVQYKQNIVNIDEFLVDLKTNIDLDDYKQLRARICDLVGLCIMFASIVAITFSVITGSALLIPAAAIGLSCVGPILGAAAMSIDEAGINKAGANGQLMHYFFTSTTPEREDDRQVLDILEPLASPT